MTEKGKSRDKHRRVILGWFSLVSRPVRFCRVIISQYECKLRQCCWQRRWNGGSGTTETERLSGNERNWGRGGGEVLLRLSLRLWYNNVMRWRWTWKWSEGEEWRWKIGRELKGIIVCSSRASLVAMEGNNLTSGRNYVNEESEGIRKNWRR